MTRLPLLLALGPAAAFRGPEAQAPVLVPAFNQWPPPMTPTAMPGVGLGRPPNFNPKDICSSLSCLGSTPLPSSQTLSGVGTGAVRCDSCQMDTATDTFDVGRRCNPQDGWSSMSHLDMLAVSTINVKGPERNKLAKGQSVQFPGLDNSWTIFEKIAGEGGKIEPDTFSLATCKRSALAKGDQDIVSLFYVGVIEYVPLEEKKRPALKLRKKIQKVKQYDLKVTLATSTYAHSADWYAPAEGNRIFIQTTTDISVAKPQTTTGVSLRVECTSNSHACAAQGWRGWVGVYCERIPSGDLKALASNRPQIKAPQPQAAITARRLLPHWTPMSPMGFPQVLASEVRLAPVRMSAPAANRMAPPQRSRREETAAEQPRRSSDDSEEDPAVQAWVESAMGEELQRRRRQQANQNIFGSRGV